MQLDGLPLAANRGRGQRLDGGLSAASALRFLGLIPPALGRGLPRHDFGIGIRGAGWGLGIGQGFKRLGRVGCAGRAARSLLSLASVDVRGLLVRYWSMNTLLSINVRDNR